MEASLDRPGNIPVVVSCPSVLYETRGGRQTERTLPLGTVVNAVFRRQQWLYVQTPHHHEGYVVYAACMPLGILPRSNLPQKKTPCWESSTDIYPQPCGNLTDTEKEQMRERTHSETHQRKPKTRSVYSEEYFDTLYLKTKSLCSNIDTYDIEQENPCGKIRSSQSEIQMTRQTLMVVSNDFVGDTLDNTLSVKQGDVVVLMQDASETDADSEWFYVKRKDGKLGFIPAVVAGHGYI
ncbi:hypothetical protein EVAR_26026_1 [Eumeta japonica]|uniref:SH3 domain-containing protein n=1 Tax=Eumeta variegata TaxID=151549 RepID=A0A4C1VT12_EUMVA|nr:hypothetical protein EVAR_26026_1 [Eumeta japonica]